MERDLLVDYYAVLSLPRFASPAAVKQAYHRLVLQYHPDKQVSRRLPGATPLAEASASISAIDIAQLNLAYATLSDPPARASYDRVLDGSGSLDESGVTGKRVPCGKRPAEVVSLDAFTVTSSTGCAKADMEPMEWTYPCRCGSLYRITEIDMEKDLHLLECGGCSEIVWVDYEEVESTEFSGSADDHECTNGQCQCTDE